MPETSPLQPGQRFGNGRFILVRFLGRGGMGEVWLAQDERLHEPVALKFLPAEIRGDAAALDDLRRETARSHKLTHPNIVRIHDLHEEESGAAFIIMEYVDGSTLADVRVQQPARVLPWEQLRPLLEQLCAALHYAHSEKVIHRDLKPANLMVDGRGRLKLADFGIAAVASDSMSRVSAQRTTSGTLPYMSPQQLTGKRPQATDDIYALGATLYELLTSKPPFYSGDLTHQVLHESPEPMEERLAALEIQNEIPPDAAALIMACLAKEPGQRPQSAMAVAEWIGLEVVRKPSLEALSKDVFSEALPEAESPALPEIEPTPPEKSAPGKRFLWAVGAFAAVILLATGSLYWHTHQLANNRRPVASAADPIKTDTPEATTLDKPGPAQTSAIPFSGPVSGTRWTVTDSDGDNYSFQFEADGTLNYEAGRGLQPNGRWQQNGDNVIINVNDSFTVLSGQISNGKMSGKALSRDEKTWTWEAIPKS